MVKRNDKIMKDIQAYLNPQKNIDELVNKYERGYLTLQETLQEVFKSNADNYYLENIDTVMKDYYTSAYPDDDLGQELDDSSTFFDLLNCLRSGGDAYSLMGGADDSIVRERLFARLDDIMNVEYGYAYDLWLAS